MGQRVGPAGRGKSKAPPLHREDRLTHLAPEDRAAMRAFGQRVRELRLAVSVSEVAAGRPRMTLAVLAARAEINSATLGELERGRVNATLSVMDRLARALGVGMSTLLEPPVSRPKPLRRARR